MKADNQKSKRSIVITDGIIKLGEEGSPKTVILMHGLTGSASVIKPVAEYLLRKLGKDFSFILPTAPLIPVTQFRGEKVRAWFDVKNSDFRKEVDAAGILNSVSYINDLISQEAEKGKDLKDIYLGGFSQGGVLAMVTALCSKAPMAGVFALSSYLPLEKQLLDSLTIESRRIPIFIAQTLRDEFISQVMYQDATDFLEKEGFEVSHKKYDTKHEIKSGELDDLAEWILSGRRGCK